MIQNVPLVPYCRNDWTRYRSGEFSLSRSGRAARAKTSRTMKTREIFIRTASARTLRAMAKIGPGPLSSTRRPCMIAVNAAARAATPIRSRERPGMPMTGRESGQATKTTAPIRNR